MSAAVWCLLGDDLELSLLRTPQAWTEKQSVEFAELSVIGHRPYLQNVGNKLDEISLEVLLHARDGDPGALQDIIAQKREDGEVLPVSLGDGSYLGDFVITETSFEPRATFANGTAYQGLLKIQLKEWVNDPNLQVSQRTKPGIRSTTAKKPSTGSGFHTDPATGHLVPNTPSSALKSH